MRAKERREITTAPPYRQTAYNVRAMSTRALHVLPFLLCLLGAAGPARAAETPTSLVTLFEVPVADSPAPYLLGSAGGFAVAVPRGAVTMYGLDGAPAWTATLPAGIAPGAVSGKGLLALPLENGTLAIIDAREGRIIAQTAIGTARPFLSIADSGVAVSDPEGSLLFVGRLDGAVAWKTSLPSAPSAAASLCGDLYLVGTAGGEIAAVSAADGRLLWARRIGERITTAPLCTDRRAWVGSADNRLHAFKFNQKRLRHRWSYLTGGDIVGRPIAIDDRILFFSYDTYLYGLEADNGHLAWKVRLARRPRPQNVLLGDLLFVAPLNTERLDLFRLPNGAQATAFTLPAGEDRFVTGPVQAGDIVLIGAARYGNESSRIIALDPLASMRDAAPGPRTTPEGARSPGPAATSSPDGESPR